MRTTRARLPIAALLAALGCGSTTNDPATGSGGSGGGSAQALCGDAPPSTGAACVPPSDSKLGDTHCSWGDDPRPDCRTLATCLGDGTWSVVQPPASCSTPPLPAACPAPPPTAGTECTDDTLSCWYDGGERCWCSSCKFGTQYPTCQPIDPPLWACASPPEGCPSVIPQAGTPCSTPGATCGPDCELQVVCEGGTWKWHEGSCPICAAPTTLVATPAGERPIAELRAGDLVYSVDHDGVVVVPILRAESTPVAHHRVVRVELEGGAVLEISPGHPTADGRSFADLAAGGTLDGRAVLRAELVPYEHVRTYDILPASDTGSYFAAGARVGSSLALGRR